MKSSILIFAGSARQGSINKKLAQHAAKTAAQLGFEATFIDLKDYPMPLYDGDIEQGKGIPESAITLEGIIKKHDAIIMASPEYNAAFTPLLKNTIDWVSRVDMGFLRTKTVGLMSASPGKGGGVRSLAMMRTWLESIRVTVAPEAFALPQAMQAFTNDDLNESKQAELKHFIYSVVKTVEEQQSIAA